MASSKEDFRVSIESMNDWSHVKANYAQATRADFERELAAAGLSNTNALSQHLDHFIDQTFRLAQPNLRVNGQSFDERGEDDIEPFDETLDRHVWSLHDQRLGLHKTIAAIRRAEPLKIEKAMLNSLEQDHELDAMESALEDIQEDFNMEVDDIHGTFEEGLQKTSALAKELSQVCVFLQFLFLLLNSHPSCSLYLPRPNVPSHSQYLLPH
ncbi:hypothetical protein GYMLUDRAFT_162798 [Collybiopsis luxurians FD-317 M1]|uniref:Uncharacterized protein n=1 Tax=Collybiopsis luxurians FD-317 M1 TaxID=944289 RepID=A0A0D0C6M8_9AGAR|nr:hypothetical protein GYMLUDRAFT_162798 [Collybiopsis luxurians FD-317 M1]